MPRMNVAAGVVENSSVRLEFNGIIFRFQNATKVRT